MPMNSAEFKEFLETKMPRVIQTNLKDRLKKMEMSDIFKKSKVNTEYVDSRQLEAMGMAQMTVEGAPLPELKMKMGYAKRKAWVEYGARIEISKRLKKLQKYDIVGKAVRELVNSPRQLIETLGAYMFTYGDEATVANIPTQNGIPCIDNICGDGLTIFNASHTFASDGANTYSNLISPFRSLTQGALQDVITTVQQWRNNVDDLMDADVERVIVASKNQYKLYELLVGSEKSETTNRAKNALNEHFQGGDRKVWKRLGDTNDWYVETNLDNDYEYLVAWDPEQENDYDKALRVWRYFLDLAVGFGVNDPRRYVAVKE